MESVLLSNDSGGVVAVESVVDAADAVGFMIALAMTKDN